MDEEMWWIEVVRKYLLGERNWPETLQVIFSCQDL